METENKEDVLDLAKEAGINQSGILNGDEILDLVRSGALKNVDESCIGSASLDLHLGENFKLVKRLPRGKTKRLRCVKGAKHNPIFKDFKDRVIVESGDCVLAETIEEFNLPDNVSCSLFLKSTIGRRFLNHMTAGFFDAGFSGSVGTLEFRNDLPAGYEFDMRKGDKLVQLVFYKHEAVSDEFNYKIKGSYNNSKTVLEGN